MKTQDCRLKELEAKVGEGDNSPTFIIREIVEPSKGNSENPSKYYGTLVGAGRSIHSVPGESFDDFEKRLMELEIDQ
jgi:hypothetical protein